MVDRDVNKKGEKRVQYCKKHFDGSETFPFSMIDRNDAKKAGALLENWEYWPNTLQAHRLMLLADQLGKGYETQDLLYAMTYERGLNISSPDVLAQAAQELALPEFVPVYLESGEGYMEVEAADQQAKASNIGVQHLPVVLMGNGAFKLEGVQPVHAYEKAIATCLVNGIVERVRQT
mmetsp:Transcript_31905/g.69673  ORF Transcript_31905/g.69673 Transcript_31905/m.69673 type:complete len:177 (-) Transcript_31905:129-659(-)